MASEFNANTVDNAVSDFKHIAEIATGRSGGVAGGASINTSTDRLGGVKYTMKYITDNFPTSVIDVHNSDANAHGTPEQRRNAMGLNNHQLVTVDSGGRITHGFGAVWRAGAQIGSTPYAGLYGTVISYLANRAAGSWVSTGGGTAGAITIDEGAFSFASSQSVADVGAVLTWTTRLAVLPSGRTLIGTTDDGTSALQVGGAIVHGTDNAWAYGSAARRGTTIYLATNPVIGSDERLKTDIEAIPGAIAAEICDLLTPCTYLYKVGGREAYAVEEDYEVDEPITEPVTTERTVVEVIDGQAVQVVKTETTQQPIYDLLPVVDESGEPVLDADGKQLTHKVQRTAKVSKTRKVTKYREIAGKRYHTGYIAQEVKAALDAVADRWAPAANLAVWLLADVDDADSTQMIRMEQVIPLIHAAMNFHNKEAK